MEDWKNSLSGGTTPTRSCGEILVPETPSPVFNGIHQSKMKTSPHFGAHSRKPLYFEEISGKFNADTEQKGKAAASKEMKRQSAFERLRAIRQKKNQKSQKSERPITYSSWPSESESDTDSDHNSPFSTQHVRNDRRRIGGKSEMPETLHRSVLENRKGSSTSIDSPFLPLRKRIKIRHPEASGSSQVNPLDNNTNSRCPPETDCGKLDASSTTKVTSPCPDFMSARQVMEGSGVEEVALSSFIRDKDSGKLSYHKSRNKVKGKGKSAKKDLPTAEKSPQSHLVKWLHRCEDDSSEDSDVEILSGSLNHSRHKHSTIQPKSSKATDLQVHTKKFYKNTAECKGSVNTKTRTNTSREQPMKSTFRSQAAVTVESDEDAVLVVNQVETDETMARRLQEEMDREFALSLAQTNSPHRPELHPQGRVRSGPVTSGFGGRMQPSSEDSDSEENPFLLGCPFMPAGNWAERHYALMTGGGNVLGMGSNWTPEGPRRRSTRQSRGGRRGQAGRMGRRNAVIGLNSPGVSGEDYEALLNLAESLGDVKPKGLTKSQINCLPVKKFVPSSGESAQNLECLVCMCEFQKSEDVRILTCFHDFHAGCIDKWLKNNNTCPICRVEVQLH
ncbi:uncharacterized protein LOC135467729 [Liolophura sinensis]|uniref:uncharacterized protein LOC135467729 n=1 Tax=Liolophura sinensis TaxID=3198878 RepID=UPI0031589A19